MGEALRTVFYECHLKLGAKITEFGGWDMPLQFPTGIVQEHLATRKEAGLFDVSHMGRFTIRGSQALPFPGAFMTRLGAVAGAARRRGAGLCVFLLGVLMAFSARRTETLFCRRLLARGGLAGMFNLAGFGSTK